MSFEKLKLKRMLIGFVGAFVATALVVVGAFMLLQPKDISRVSCQVLSTDTGDYYNVVNGGRVFIGGTNSGGATTSLGVKNGTSTTLTAVANEGYGFAGFYNQDQSQLLSLEENYEIQVTENVQITAKFAKLYPISLTLEDPFEENKEVTINKLCYVGECVSTFDIVNEFYGEEYAVHFQNSTASPLNQDDNYEDFVFAQSAIVVGAESADLKIQPTDPQNMGASLPSGYNQESEYLFFYTATGISDYDIGGSPTDGFWHIATKSGCKVYELVGDDSVWCYFDPLAFEIETYGRYIVTGIQMRYYSMEKYYDSSLNWQYKGWTSYFDANAKGIYADEVGAVQVEIKTAQGYVATFYSDQSTVLEKKTYAKNTAYSMPTILPEKEGFTFAGWTNDKESASVSWTSGTKTITKDISWYPVWERRNVINYNYLNSSMQKQTYQDSESTQSYFSCVDAYPDKVQFEIDIVPNKNFVCDGKTYDFIGYALDNTATTVYGNLEDVDGLSTTIEISGKQLDLYGVYRSSLNVRYDATWGYDPPMDASVYTYKIAGSTGVITPAVAYKISDITPTNDQGTFKGWLHNKILYNPADTITITTDTTLTAKWEFYMILTGEGTYENPYTISTVGELQSFMACVNDGRYGTEFFKLLNDIEVETLEPIGFYDTIQDKKMPFKGVFDGNGYTITANINLPDQDYVGLFGYNEGTIQNLNVNGTFVGKSYVGAVCGYNIGIVSGCQNIAEVKGYGNYIGGIIGGNEGGAEKLYSQGKITTLSDTGFSVGGVIGINLTDGIVINIINESEVNANTYQWVGGIVGQNHGSVENFYNAGNITGAYYVGGIVGLNGEGVILNGYNIGEINSLNTYSGAIVGATNNGIMNYLYYFVDSAYDGSGTLQKSVGTGTLSGSAETDPNGVKVLEGETASTTVLMDDGTEHTLLWALNIGIEFFADSTGGAYCNWVEVSNRATIFYNNQWNAISGEGSTTIGWTGTGTLYDPYQIGAVGDILLLTEKVSLGITYKNLYFKMTYDIDFSTYSEEWTPIGGYNAISGKTYAFEGTFNGGGHAIKNLELSPSSNYVGLFGYSSGIIQNLTMTNCSISGKEYVGSVVGYNAGKVINCINQSQVDGTKYVGGVVGYNAGLIDKTINEGEVKITSSNAIYIGGITGFNKNDSIVRNSYSIGIVTATNSTCVGGLVGQNEGRVINCFNQGVTTAGSYVGGIVGFNKGTIQNVYASGTVNGTNNYAGSIIGSSEDEGIKFAYYLSNIAKDGNSKIQNGVGNETKGSATTNNDKIFTIFNQDTTFDEIQINNQFSTTLVWALNLGHQYYSVDEFGLYVTWTQNVGEYPTLITEDLWNDTSFWMFEGHGTELNPFLIKTQNDLYYLSLYVNMGNSFKGQYFKLVQDIICVMEGAPLWIPIGYYDYEQGKPVPFEGVFDGNNFKIDGMDAYGDSDYVGLFGYNAGHIKNLGVTGAVYYGNNYVGAICGFNTGTIENCYNSSTVYCNESYGGGIAGGNQGQINKCYNILGIFGTNDTFGNGLGGIVGINKSQAEVYNCFTYGYLSGEKYHAVGGLIGVNEGKVLNSFVSAESEIYAACYVGGLVGKNIGHIICAYSTGVITGYQTFIGAIAGQNTGSISNTFYYKDSALDGNETLQTGIGCEVLGSSSADILSQTAPFDITGCFDENFYVEETLVEIILEAMLASHAIISAEESDKYIVWRDDDSVWYPVIYEIGEPPLTWLTTNAQAAFNGQGTEENPYTIETMADLNTFVAYVNAGRSFAGEFVSLKANLQAHGAETNQWVTIGQYNEESEKNNYFAGTFDGNGYTISGVYINKSENYQGVFGYSTGVIKNLTVSGTIRGGNYVGGIVGFNTGSIINCVNQCVVEGSGSYIGGIAGGSNGKIEKCYTTGAVSGKSSTTGNSVGGIVGINLIKGEIKTSFAQAKVSAINYYSVGGIAGQSEGLILNCYTSNDVTGCYNVGGVVGKNTSGSVTNSISYGKVTGTETYVGGVVGSNTEEGKISYTYYLEENATDGAGNIQGGIGQSALGAKLDDVSNSYMTFNKQLKIGKTNIEGTEVDNVIDALNVFALSDRQNGRANDSWQRDTSGWPAFGFNESWDGETTETFVLGNGTKENPYQIANASQLKYLQVQSSLGETYKNTYFVLTNDIYVNNISITSRDVNVNVWEPIKDFAGHFNGQNYAVHGIFIANLDEGETEIGSEDYKGLFGNVTGTISNLCTFDGYIEGFQFVGGIAGASEGTITNCFNNNTIKAFGNFVGGIVGQSYGFINSCGNFGEVNATGNYIGGIVGKSTNTILNSYNLATISSTGDGVGGIVGVSGNLNIANCYNTGAVVANSLIGGIVGDNASVLTNCYNLGSITGNKNYVGSLIGKNSITLNQNFYLAYSANCSGNIQGAVGSENNAVIADNAVCATAFNDKFMIPAIRVGGIEVSDFVEALNEFIAQNPLIENVPLYKWEMSSDYPMHKRFWQGGVATAFSGGDGTETNPYKIASAEDLAYLASRVNNGEDFFSVYFVLTNDIVLNDDKFEYDKDSGLVKVSDGTNVAYLGTGLTGEIGGESQEFDWSASSIGTWYSSVDGYSGKYTGELYEWTPIGTISIDTGESCDFAGHFDGNGFTVSGLYINNNTSTQGLFGQVSGVVKNIGIINSYIAGNTYVGAVVGYNSGTITNVYSNAVVLGKTSSVGELCGYITDFALLANAYAMGKAFAPENAGNLVGEVYGTLKNVYSYGEALPEENQLSVLGKVSNEDNVSGVYVWSTSALLEDYSQVTTENYADVVTSLNKVANEEDWYAWAINSLNGQPSFITKIIWDGTSATEFSGGDGTEKSPYLISNAQELAYFSSLISRGTHAKLTNDIYLNDETFEFVFDTGLVKVTDGKKVGYFGTGIKGDASGSNTKFDNVASVKGVWYVDENGTKGTYKGTLNEWTAIADLETDFDGNGFTVYGMYSFCAFIETMTANLSNLTVANSLTYNQTLASGIVANYMGGTISNCVNLGIVIGGDASGIACKVSSIVTENKEHSGTGYTIKYSMERTQIIKSKNLGVIIGASVGGIVGYGEFIEKISDCFNVGPIYATSKAAGIIYTYNGRYEETGKTFTIQNSHNYAEISGKDYTAGIIANLLGGQEKTVEGVTYKPSKILIDNVTNSKNIIGSVYSGGIIGYAVKQSVEELKIQNVTNTANVLGLNYTGGVIGRITYGILENAENTGSVEGITSVGGITGYGAVKITNAKNFGKVKGFNNVGGIVGYLFDANYSVKQAYNFAPVNGTCLIGGIVGKLSSNGAVEEVYNSGKLSGTHSVGGIVGEADSGSITKAYVATMFEADYFVGGVVGNASGTVTFKDCFYPYGLITALSCAEKEQTGIGSPSMENSNVDPDGVSHYTQDLAFTVSGSVDITDVTNFITSAKVEEIGAGMFVVDNKDNYCLLDDKVIVPHDYGISPASGKSIILAYKAKSTVTLYANGQGEILASDTNWAVTYQGQTASKVLYANAPIGQMPVMYDEFYSFDGWYVDSECLGQKITGASVYDFSYTKLYAKWIIETFTITINTEGICQIPETSGWWISNDGYTATKHLTSLDAVGKLPVLEQDGYTFEGWFIDPEFNYRISPSSLFWAREDTTMYPKLTPNTLELSIRLNDVEWLNSGVNIEVYKVVDAVETLVWSAEDVQDATITVDKALEKGFYTVYASRKADKLTELYQIGAITYVEGMVNFVIDYYSLTLTRGDEGINSVYIAEENEVYINGQDIHNNAQIYLRGQSIVISAVVAEGNGFEWNAWIDANTGDQYSTSQDLEIESIDQSFVFTASSN